MTKPPKIFLTLSVTSFVAGLTAAGSSMGWGILRPLSAIFFVFFLITKFLEKEVAQYEEETRMRIALAAGHPVSPAACQPDVAEPAEPGKNAPLTAAHSH